MKIERTIYAKEISPVEFCGKTIGYVIDVEGEFTLPYETQPTKGEHDFSTCEGCQNTLKELNQSLKVRFEGSKEKEGFPFCCEHHRKLTKFDKFKRTDFLAVPEMVARKIIYTNQHIKNNHKSEDYLKEITDYIEYTLNSFGSFPKGCGSPFLVSDYFFYVRQLVENNEEISIERKSRIIEYLNTQIEPNLTSSKTDLNALISTYEKWLKAFPFQLGSYFGNLRERFQNELPLLAGKPEYNQYSRLSKAKLHTRGSLVDYLNSLTIKLISEINGISLFEAGVVTNTNKIKLELLLADRRAKIEEVRNNEDFEGETYRRILKEWLKDEKEFWESLTPLISVASDIDFIRGNYKLYFVPRGEDGVFEVKKGAEVRTFSIQKYFDLDLTNWEAEIDKANTKTDKLNIANNAIFQIRKDFFHHSHPSVLHMKEKHIKHLYDIAEYINKCYPDTISFDDSGKVIEIEQENNVTKSTIDEHLEPFKDRISPVDYTLLVESLLYYFDNGELPVLTSSIKIKGKVNVKAFGWALKELYKDLKSGTLSFDYLHFAKTNISLFKDVSFSKENYTKSTLYKYFTTKTK